MWCDRTYSNFACVFDRTYHTFMPGVTRSILILSLMWHYIASSNLTSSVTGHTLDLHLV